MNTIQFTTVIGADGVIHPPAGVELPRGAMEVVIRPAPDITKDLEDRARELAASHGFEWDAASDDVRAMLLDDARLEERGERRPRPAPGAFKGSILYMAPDFDSPLEDMKEYME